MQTYVSEYKSICEDYKLFESTRKTKQQEIRELSELYNDILIVDKRIKNNIKHIQEILKTKPKVSKDFVDNTNQSFLDMLTNYEITVARYSKFVFEFDVLPTPKSLQGPMKDLVNSMKSLNDIVLDFNEDYPNFKLLVPFEESEIASTIYNLGFNIVSEKDWTKLVKYRG